MNRVCHIIFRLVEKIFRSKGISMVFETKQGIKNINVTCTFDKNITQNMNDRVVYIDINDLYLGPDYLADQYTLLDRPLKFSPHVTLMSCLHNHGDHLSTDYIKRFKNGTLDWRRGYSLPRNKNYWKNQFTKAYDNCISETYLPVLVYKIGEKYYIFDGKHRAAMCSILGKNIKCKIIDIKDFYLYSPLLFCSQLSKSQYNKHQIWINNSIKGVMK